MCLVALQDPGLTVFPTHRLVTHGRRDKPEALRDADLHARLRRRGRRARGAAPARRRRPAAIGCLDRAPRPLAAHAQGPGDRRPGAARLPPAYRRLDTAVLEALILEDALGMSEDDISHLRGLGYSRTDDEARSSWPTARTTRAFFLRADAGARRSRRSRRPA